MGIFDFPQGTNTVKRIQLEIRLTVRIIKVKAVMTSGQGFDAKILMEVIMGDGANVNVRVVSKGNNINVKVDKQRRIANLNKAQHLQSKFGPVADNSLGFLRKCFNRMSEDKVWQLYESATRRNAGIINPFAYFIGAAKAQPEMK